VVDLDLREEVLLRDDQIVTLEPEEQKRDWRQRWRLMEQELAELLKPQTGPLSAEAVVVVADRVLVFFVESYSLKEALRKEEPKHNVEAAIKVDADVGILIDLANLDKHGGKLDAKHTPKTKIAPAIDSIRGELRSGTPGWELRMVIKHGSAQLDGLDVANKGVAAWRRWLQGEGLI
jgi:hypothetical protein